MKIIKKNNRNIILLVWLIIPLFLSVPNISLNYENDSIKRAGWTSNADWHEESNKSTTEVDITYTESIGSGDGSGLTMLEQRMSINYKDGTNAAAGFATGLKFNDGGIVGGVVDDWSKINYTEPTFYSDTPLSGRNVAANYKFNGFSIYKGNSTSITLSNITLPGGWALKLDESKKIGDIDVLVKNYKVGVVTLSTAEVLYDGNTETQSIANFDIIVNATIGNTTHTHDTQVIYQFEVRHMINETRYKFGVEINWTGYEDFPTELNMDTGDEYFLVASDRLSVGIETFAINTFESNPENDTAIFKFEDEEICRQYFTTAFNINLTGSDTSTSRLYLQNYTTQGGYGSRTYVFFDGFKYGQSNGISYDPTIVIPCSFTPEQTDDNLIPFSNLYLVFLTISIIALVVMVKNRKKTIRF
ncbi:MAG: hypothetical protein ACTSQW_01625 [Promethearchaeota archaeon]